MATLQSSVRSDPAGRCPEGDVTMGPSGSSRLDAGHMRRCTNSVRERYSASRLRVLLRFAGQYCRSATTRPATCKTKLCVGNHSSFWTPGRQHLSCGDARDMTKLLPP